MGDGIPVDDILETVHHFRAIDYLICWTFHIANLNTLRKEMKEFHRIIPPCIQCKMSIAGDLRWYNYKCDIIIFIKTMLFISCSDIIKEDFERFKQRRKVICLKT